MEALFALIAAAVALIGIDLAATRWGTDSRPGMVDDHRR
jgi:nitrogen fixation-related uncharacterized protein